MKVKVTAVQDSIQVEAGKAAVLEEMLQSRFEFFFAEYERQKSALGICDGMEHTLAFHPDGSITVGKV